MRWRSAITASRSAYIPSGSWVSGSMDKGDKHQARVAAIETQGWWLWKRAVGLTIDISILSDGQ